MKVNHKAITQSLGEETLFHSDVGVTLPFTILRKESSHVQQQRERKLYMRNDLRRSRGNMM